MLSVFAGCRGCNARLAEPLEQLQSAFLPGAGGEESLSEPLGLLETCLREVLALA